MRLCWPLVVMRHQHLSRLLKNTLHSPNVHAVHGMGGVGADIDRVSETVAGLACDSRILQQDKLFTMPGGIPVRSGGTIEDQAGNAECGGDVHGAGVVADEEPGMSQQAYETGKRGGFDLSHPVAECGLLFGSLNNPGSGIGFGQMIGKPHIAVQWPALVVAAGTGVNDDLGLRCSGDHGREVGRWGMVRNFETEMLSEGLQQGPVLMGDQSAQIQWDTMLCQSIGGQPRIVRADDAFSTAGGGEQMGDIALIIPQKDGVGFHRAPFGSELQQTPGAFPGTVEFGSGTGEELHARCALLVDLAQTRAGGHDDAGFRQGAAQMLHHRQEDNIVAELVDLGNEDRHDARYDSPSRPVSVNSVVLAS